MLHSSAMLQAAEPVVIDGHYEPAWPAHVWANRHLNAWRETIPGVTICPGSCLACRAVLTVIGTFYRAFDNYQLGLALFPPAGKQGDAFRGAKAGRFEFKPKQPRLRTGDRVQLRRPDGSVAMHAVVTQGES